MNEVFLSHLTEYEYSSDYIQLLFRRRVNFALRKQEVLVVIRKYDTIYYEVVVGKEDDWVTLLLLDLRRVIEKRKGENTIYIEHCNSLEEKWLTWKWENIQKKANEEKEVREVTSEQKDVRTLLSVLEQRKQQALQPLLSTLEQRKQQQLMMHQLEKKIKEFEEKINGILF